MKLLRTSLILAIFISCLLSLKESFAMTANESINNFAFNAAKIIREDSQEYFFSPYSIISAFGMAYAGAEGNTAREIEEVLGLGSDFHSQLGNFIKDIEVESAITSANRVWLRKGLKLKDIFKENLLMNYGSTAKELNFKNDTEHSRRIINKWISDKTNAKIPELLTQLDPETQMILTNAIYFNAGWDSKFDKSMTSKEKFFTDSSENSQRVDMMKKYGDFLYAQRDGNKIIKIPYEGGRFSLLVFLPSKEEKSLELDAEIFNDLLSSMTEYEVDLWLPKFKTEKHYALKNIFDALGIKLAFSNFADFSGMTDDEKLKIDNVIHQTFIDVDEEKTEAAAATAIVMVRTTAMPMDKKPKAIFHADRPFEYFIIDNYTKTILFAGRQTFENKGDKE